MNHVKDAQHRQDHARAQQVQGVSSPSEKTKSLLGTFLGFYALYEIIKPKPKRRRRRKTARRTYRRRYTRKR